VLRPKPDAKPLDLETVRRLGRVAGAEDVLLEDGAGVFGFGGAGAADAEVVRGRLELAARFELGAHWHTRYEFARR
jgi:hypothetical protein